MPRIQHLDNVAQEEGTYPLKFTFTDSLRRELSASAITSVTWWLTGTTGTVVNERSAVEVSAITNPQYIVLSGDDLQILDSVNGSEERLLTLKGLYDSDLGDDLPFTYAVSFTVLNNLVVT